MRKLLSLAGIATAAVAFTAGGAAVATPGASITTSTVSLGRFDEIKVKTDDAKPHRVKIDTRGASDVYVVSNTISPGGHSGWHTHAGPSLITVKSGTITAYDADDPACAPTVYPAGTGFVDPGDGHVHVLRNEGMVDAVTVAVQLLPAGSERRSDAAAPPGCSG